ncbi:MAG: helix-turn-helix transcriptional regulator [Bacteroidales bacterium]|nr:helix-turn-helix transcriptional regulator [Bacteroidales bacterium]
MTDSFELLDIDALNEASEMLKAMAHPLRIAILRLLKAGKPLTVSEIHELLSIEQSAASHHLGILKTRGIVCAKRKGKNIYYTISHERISNVIDCIQKCRR